MSSKRQEINKIINKFIKYGRLHKFPMFDDDVKIRKFKRDYTPDHIAGLVFKYLVPPYKEGIDSLKGYIMLELDRMRMLGALSGVDEMIINFQLSEEQHEYVIGCIVEIIDVINA